MNDCLHIYNEKEQLDVLKILYQEKKSLAVEISYDENEF